MSWLNKIGPLQLYQSSDIPYVLLENGLYLCYDNAYSTYKDETNQYKLSFKTDRTPMLRLSANFFKFKDFPVTIPFGDVTSLNKIIIEGHLIKHTEFTSPDETNIIIITDQYTSQLGDNHLNNLVDELDGYDKRFLIAGDEISPQSRLLDEMVITLPQVDWARTCVSIAHHSAKDSTRKYGWTRQIPPLNIICYGIDNRDIISEINDHFKRIGVECSVRWEA